MAFPCKSYADFASGQCTGRLNDDTNYHQQCRSKHITSPGNPSTEGNQTHVAMACPVRLGLESRQDYVQNANERSQPLPDSADVDPKLTPLVYFLQTNDKLPFCHFHYEVRIVLKFTTHLKHYRSYRSRQFALDNWMSSGKLTLTVVGSRSRFTTDVQLKQSDFDETKSSGNLRQYTLLVAHSDLGQVLRVELEWRPSAPTTQRSLALIQSRAVRRWLPQFGMADTALPNVIADFQRSMINGSQIALNLGSSLLNSHGNEMMAKSDAPSLATPAALSSGVQASVHSVFPMPSSPSAPSAVDNPNAEALSQSAASPPSSQNYVSSSAKFAGGDSNVPIFEAVIITKLESDTSQVFCTKESKIKSLFQAARGSAKIAILLASPSSQSAGSPAESLVALHCH